MSMTLMVRAMHLKIGNPLRKLVLIKLADNANDHGECWPSYQHIADQCEIGRSTVRKHIKDLEQMGFLRIENRPGPKGNSSNLYHLMLHGVSPDSTGGVAPDSTRISHSLESVKEPIKSSVDDHSQDVLDIYHSIIDQMNPNWAKAKTFDAARKRLCNQAYNTVKQRANQLGMRPLNVFGNLLEAMAVDSFYSGNPTHQKPDGYRCSIETNLNPKRLKQAIDQLGGDE